MSEACERWVSGQRLLGINETFRMRANGRDAARIIVGVYRASRTPRSWTVHAGRPRLGHEGLSARGWGLPTALSPRFDLSSTQATLGAKLARALGSLASLPLKPDPCLSRALAPRAKS
jgi:hypothetical protein